MSMIHLLGAALLAGTAPSTANAVDVANAYVAWRGGEAFRRIRAVHEVGNDEFAGVHGTLDRWTGRNGQLAERRDFGRFQLVEAVGPAGGWSRDPSGQVESLSASERMDELRQSLVLSGVAFRGGGGATVVRAADEVEGGRTWATLHVSFGDADAYELLVDPKSGQLGGERILRDGRKTVIRFGDWRVVAGCRFAFSEDVRSPISGMDRKVVLTSVTLDGAVPADALRRPESRQLAHFQSGSHGSGWLPFALPDGRHIFIDAVVNGTKISALIDSGAAGTVIDAALAQRLGLSSSGSMGAPGAGAVAKAGVVTGLNVTLGSVDVTGLPAASIDLSSLARLAGRPISIVIGKDLMNQFVVDIDFEAQRLAFLDPATFAAPAGAKAIEVLPEGPLRVVQASVEGGAPAQFHFDLGNGAPLVLYAGPGGRLAPRQRTAKALTAGVGGLTVADAVTVGSVKFAGVQFQDVPAIVMPPTQGATTSERIAGNLGLPVFQRFHLMIDYPHDRLWLKPRKGSLTAPFERDRSGLGVVPEAANVLVRLVSRGSPAASAGLKEGDRITSVNGAKVDDAYVASGLARWRYGAAGSVEDLGLSDGSHHRVVLADYF